MKVCSDVGAGDVNSHVKVKQKGAVQNMLRRLDKIRFRGQKRDEFPYLAESPNASDTECGDEITLKISRSSKDNEELKDPANSETIIMASGIPEYNRTETDRLNEVKGHLEIALLEKHFLQEELRKLREETNIETLKQDLEKERQKRVELEQKMTELVKASILHITCFLKYSRKLQKKRTETANEDVQETILGQAVNIMNHKDDEVDFSSCRG